MSTVSERLQQAREAAGLSEMQVAQLVGCHQLYIFGESWFVSDRLLGVISGVLNVRAEWLRTGEGPRREGEPL